MLGTAGCLTIDAEAGRRCRLNTQIAKAAARSHALNILDNALVLRNDAEEDILPSDANAGGCRLSTDRRKLQLQTQSRRARDGQALKDEEK